ncbi:prosaposin-like [Branchiostoma lanceolatum]|uniref:prosaposin-like n=1 Tax=Branchiostoma lanceolatum TaxID=7740 RepID=UPI0034513493
MYRWSVVCVLLCVLGHCASAHVQPREISKQAFSIHTNEVQDLKQCLECLSLGEAVRAELSKSATQQFIMKLLEKACMLLPTAESAQCLSTLDNVGPMFMAYLIEKLEPAAVCRDLGICDASGSALARKHSNNFKGTNVTIECHLCEMLVSAVKDEVDSYQWYIKGFMDDFCARLPVIVQPECQKMVDEKYPDVVKIIDQILDPQVACTALKACQ